MIACMRHTETYENVSLTLLTGLSVHHSDDQPLEDAPAVAALSTHLSTAALDKNPQSQERGITLDLGFSSFTVNSKANRW